MVAAMNLLFAAAWSYCLVASRNRPMYLWLVGKQPSYGICFNQFAVCYVVGTLRDGRLGPTRVQGTLSTQSTFLDRWREWPRTRPRAQPRFILHPGQSGSIGLQVEAGGTESIWIEYHRTFVATPYVVPLASCLIGALLITFPALRARRRRLCEGRCHHCGYDLRATPTRCPECGTVPPHAQSPIP